MSKNEFLDELRRKLSVLNEDEKNDIINEYTDIIDEKVKHGKSVSEAILDFGDIDDLAKEILSAYKIDPNYESDNKSAFSKKIESIFGRFKFVPREITFGFVLEIIFKIFVTIVGMLVLKWVFTIFDDMGDSLFDGFGMLDDIASISFGIFLFIIYILIGVLFVIAMFKGYFEEKPKGKEEAPSTLSSNNSDRALKKSKDGLGICDVILLIVKIMVIIYFFIPLIIFIVFLFVCLLFCLFYLISGINLVGLLILLIGMITLCVYVFMLVFNLLYGKKSPNIIALIAGVLLSAFGTIMFVNMVLNVDYIDKAPSKVDEKVITREFKTDKKVLVSASSDALLAVDDSLADGVFKVSVTYNKNYSRISFSNTDNYSKCSDFDDDECEDKTLYNYVCVNNETFAEATRAKEIYNSFIDNLKDNKVYNYDKLYDISVKVSANSNTLKDISLY